MQVRIDSMAQPLTLTEVAGREMRLVVSEAGLAWEEWTQPQVTAESQEPAHMR